jgi:glycosyltransferase involved in cell wall biosynthesis
VRVGVDATSWVNRRGYGRFARNAVGRLVEADPDTRYVLYIDDETAEHATLPESAEVQRVTLTAPPSEAASAQTSRSIRDILRLTRAVRRDSLDAFLFPSLYTYFPVMGVPTVVGVHDAIPSELPSLTMPSARARTFWRAKQDFALRRAARIFTVSEALRTAISHRLKVPAERLALVPEAPDPVFRPVPAQQVEAAREEVGLDRGEAFLLYAGGISPHKDVETLVEAHALVGGEPRLVLVGDLESETYVSAAAAVRERIAARGLDGRVLLPGFVSDETLAALYSGAHVVVNPSLAEGFGLPAVEAAACGAALVLSDLPAHRETLGDDAMFFQPGDPEQLAAALSGLLGSDEVRIELGRRARAAVAGLTWDAAADRLRTLLVEAAETA